MDELFCFFGLAVVALLPSSKAVVLREGDAIKSESCSGLIFMGLWRIAFSLIDSLIDYFLWLSVGFYLGFYLDLRDFSRKL